MFESRPNDSNKEDTGDEEESKKSAGARFKRLKNAFADPMTEAYLEFFSSVLPPFHFLQSLPPTVRPFITSSASDDTGFDAKNCKAIFETRSLGRAIFENFG